MGHFYLCVLFHWISLQYKGLLQGPLDCKEIQPVNPKGNQSWIFIGRTDVEAEAPVLWLPDAKSWLIGKGLDAGKDWRWEEKGTTEDEMVGWHHWLNGHEFEQTLRVGDGLGGLACCGPWGRKKSDMTEWLNWTDYSIEWTHYKLLSILLGNFEFLSNLANLNSSAYTATRY